MIQVVFVWLCGCIVSVVCVAVRRACAVLIHRGISELRHQSKEAAHLYSFRLSGCLCWQMNDTSVVSVFVWLCAGIPGQGP